ncbi:MAG: hypothetical protein AAGD08_14665 [Pseudomonadota bacterium]
MLQLLTLAIAAALAVRFVTLPVGRDLLVVIAAVPWVDVSVDIGVALKISDVLMIAAIAKYLHLGVFSFRQLPGIDYFLAFLALSLCAAVYTIEYGPAVPDFAGGSLTRNGYGRVFITLVKILIIFGFIAAIISLWRKAEPMRLVRAYVLSCLALAGLGLVQLAVFIGTGTDIFPIGLLSASDPEQVREAFVGSGSGKFIRVSSFGGEPKGLGQSLAVALGLLIAFGRYFAWSWKARLIAGLILATVIFLTASASALIVLFVILGAYVFFTRSKRPLDIRTLATVMACIGALLIAGFYVFADSFDLSRRTILTGGSVAESFFLRSVSGLQLDDADHLTMETFVDDAPMLLFGHGLGLSHHYSHAHIPAFARYYLEGSIIPPKSGVTYFLGNGGLIGTVFIFLMLLQFIPSSRLATRARSPMATTLICRYQAISIGLVTALLLRLYTFEAIWIVLATGIVFQRQLADSLPSAPARRATQRPGYGRA